MATPSHSESTIVLDSNLILGNVARRRLKVYEVNFMAQLYFKKTSDRQTKAVEGEDTGEMRIVICGKQAGGAITPILVDASGKIITTT